MNLEQHIGERIVATETKVDALQNHVADCVSSFRPGIEARLRVLETRFAAYTGGLAALQIIIAWCLAVYLKKSP